MSRPLIVRPAAEAELAESYRWYEKQKPGLGRDFLAEMEAAFAKIAEAPLRYAAVHKETRRILTKRFPFAVFYVAEPGKVVILAALHQARDPERWRRQR